MNRRGFLGRLATVAAAVLGASVVAPKAEAAEAAEIPNPHQADIDAALTRAESSMGTWSDVSLVTRYNAPAGAYAPLHSNNIETAISCLSCDWTGEWTGSVSNIAIAARDIQAFERHLIEAHGSEDLTGRQLRETVWRTATATNREADTYNRGIAIAEARAESRLAEGLPLKRGALTFAEMAKDCEARGCEIRWGSLGYRLHLTYPPVWQFAVAPPISAVEIFEGTDLADVDAWRRSLHGTES